MPSILAYKIEKNFNATKKKFIANSWKAGKLLADEMRKVCPVRTRYLKANIYARDYGDGFVEVVSMARYSNYADQGTSKMSARPFFRSTIERMRATLKRILFDV